MSRIQFSSCNIQCYSLHVKHHVLNLENLRWQTIFWKTNKLNVWDIFRRRPHSSKISTHSGDFPERRQRSFECSRHRWSCVSCTLQLNANLNSKFYIRKCFYYVHSMLLKVGKLSLKAEDIVQFSNFVWAAPTIPNPNPTADCTFRHTSTGLGNYYWTWKHLVWM